MHLDYSLLILGLLDLAFGVAGLFGKTKIPVKYAGKSWSRAYGRDMAIGEIILGVFWVAATLIVGFVEMSSSTRADILLGSVVPGVAYGLVAGRKYRKMLKDGIQ